MFGKILQQLWGSSSQSSKQNQPTESSPTLTDADYEFLFTQLLEGVAHGWYPQRILKFFKKLGDRGKPDLWISWLQRFGEKNLTASVSNRPLAVRMLKLGELMEELPSIRSIGAVSSQIGRQLIAKEQGRPIIEYDGPDEEVSSETTEAVPEMLTLDQLISRLQQDQTLLDQVASQFGLENTDPQILIQKLTEQLTNLVENPPEQPQTLQYWFDRGVGQAQLGDLQEAIASWDQALALDPTFFPAWHNRGSALLNLGKAEEAIASFDQALALNSTEAQIWQGRANAYQSLKRWPEALENWEKMLELDPNNLQAWYHRGSVLEELERYQEASSCYEKALEIDPYFEPARSRRNMLLDKSSPEG